jgi:hypothetical protein
MRNALTYAQTELKNTNLMRRYIISLNGLIKNNFPNYELNVKTGNNHNFAKPNSGNQTNLRLIRKNKQANLILHRKGNGVNIAWGLTQPTSRGQGYGTKIRALAALAALRVHLPLSQWSVFGKNSGSYKIMKRLGAIERKNKTHFKFVPGRHNLNTLRKLAAS